MNNTAKFNYKSNSYNDEEFINMMKQIFKEEIEDDQRKLNNNININNDSTLFKKIDTNILTAFNIDNISNDDLIFCINNKVMINTEKLDINNELILYEKISEIFLKHNAYIIIKDLIKNISLITPKTAKEIYSLKNKGGIFFDLYSYKEKEPYIKKENEEKLLFLKNMYLIRKYLFLNWDVILHDFITNKNYFIEEYIYFNLNDYKKYEETKIKLEEKFNENNSKYNHYKFPTDLKNELYEFFEENMNTKNYINEFILDIYTINIDDIRNNMFITPEELFFNDIKKLNKNITEEIAKLIYDNCLKDDIRDLYRLKAKRKNIMGKYKYIKLNLNIKKEDNVNSNKNNNINNNIIKNNDDLNNKENINDKSNDIKNKYELNTENININKENKKNYKEVNNTTTIKLSRGKIQIINN